MSDLNCTPEIVAIANKNIKDITGQRFGRLIVLGYVGSVPGKKTTLWLCRCDCGNECVPSGHNLRTGNTRSCGCLFTETVADTGQANKTHGMKETTEYVIWDGMMARCYNPNNPNYFRYGGRGISVCERWHRFEPFFFDMGFRPGLEYSLDRKNNESGNYEPDNCHWATREEQANNKRNNRLIDFRDETHTLAQWSRIIKIPYTVLKTRLNQEQWTVERAFSTPVEKYTPRKKSEK